MAVIEIIMKNDGSSGLHPEQREGEVLMFFDKLHTAPHGWHLSSCRHGEKANESGEFPFFVHQDDMCEEGWKSFVVAGSSNRTTRPIFRVWFSNSDIDCLKENTPEYLKTIRFFVPMANSNNQQRKIVRRYKDRILDVARDLLLPN